MLIVIGPQGSGNHLFGKIFSLHDDVHGWKAALEPDGYFIPHWCEPFNEFWNDPSKITVDIMGGPIIAEALIKLDNVPCISPCSFAGTCSEITACMAGPAIPPKQ